MKNVYKVVTVIVLSLMLFSACSPVSAQALYEESPSSQAETEDEDVQRPEGWEEQSHGDEVDPDYDVVFPEDTVNEITISISPENWQSMLENMTELYGEFGTSQQMGNQPGGWDNRPQNAAFPEGEMDQQQTKPQPDNLQERPDMPAEGEMPQVQGAPQTAQEGAGMPSGRDQNREQGMPGIGGGNLEMEENPVWVTATIEFSGETWTNVGIRFKGNSSLKSSWSSGNYKIPFKLDFDEFEEDYPEINNQRFYGFKQLSFSSNFGDESFLHERVTADIFREAGVVSSHTAYYAVYIDTGDGPQYFGLYTAVEVVDDTVIEEQFEDGSGNVYKPSGTGATFAGGSFNENDFDKETNAEEADWSDIQALYTALHSETRLSDPQTWRAGLETVFDVDAFIKWLAVNTLVQNWDTYGGMAHNYYLYHDPQSDLLTWIPWDNNEAMVSKGGRANSLSLGFEEVSDQWPLISYLMEDEVYWQLYLDDLEETLQGAFEPQTVIEELTQLHTLIEPYVVGENGEVQGYTNLKSEQDFYNGLEELIAHVNQRYEAAKQFLADNP